MTDRSEEILGLYRRGLSLDYISERLGVSLIDAAMAVAQAESRSDSVPPSATVANVHPRVSEVSIPHGSPEVLLGTGPDSGSAVYWNPTQVNNPHLMVIGQSGSGKTYSIQCILLELLKRKIPAVIIDYGQGFNLQTAEAEFRNAAQIQELHAGRDGLRLNPLEIRVSDVNGPKNVAARIAGTFKRIYDKLGEQQHQVLIEAILECFRRKKIYAEQPATWSRTPPFMDDVDAVLQEMACDQENPSKATAATLKSHLGTFFMYRTFRIDGIPLSWDTCLDGSEVTIVQLKGLDGEVPRIVTEFLLWNLFAFVESLGPVKALRVFTVLDEAHNLDYGKDTPVDKIVRESRKFGLGLILSSQHPKDFSESAFANTASKLVFFVDDEGGKLANRLSKSLPKENKQTVGDIITSLPKGTAYFVSEKTGLLCRILSLTHR